MERDRPWFIAALGFAIGYLVGHRQSAAPPAVTIDNRSYGDNHVARAKDEEEEDAEEDDEEPHIPDAPGDWLEK